MGCQSNPDFDPAAALKLAAERFRLAAETFREGSEVNSLTFEKWAAEAAEAVEAVLETQQPMPIERALMIVGALCGPGFAAMGYPQKPADIDIGALSIEEMLTAVKMVREHPGQKNEDGTTTVYVVPDDRMTAAIYALVHYSAGTAPIAVHDGKMIGVVPARDVG